MSSLDLLEYASSEGPEPKVLNQKANAMKTSQQNYVQDQAANYPSFTANFNLAALKSVWTDKGNDYLAVPWILYSTSNTGFSGTETVAWVDSPLSLINQISEVGLGEAAITFYQENSVEKQRNVKLNRVYTHSAAQSTLEEIGLNIPDAPFTTATGNGGYAPGLNSALAQQIDFFQATSTFSSGSTTVNGSTTANGYYSGIAYIRMKYICDCREKLGIKKFASQLNITFNGQNGQNFPFYIPSVKGPTTQTGLAVAMAIGNPTLSSLRYHYKTIEFSPENEQAMIQESQKPIQFDTYQLASVNGLNSVNTALQTLQLANGINYPKNILAYGVPTGVLTSNLCNWPSTQVTSSKFTNVNAQLDSIFVSTQPFSDSFQQWSEQQECCSFYGSTTQGPAISYQEWVQNQILEVNLRRATLNMGTDPLSARTINFQFQRTDSNTSQMFIFIYYSKCIRFIYDPEAQSFRAEDSVLLLK